MKTALFDEVRRIPSQLLHLPRTFRLVWSSTGKWTLLWLAILVALGILPAAGAIWTKALVDAFVAGIKTGGSSQTSHQAFLYGGLLVASALLSEVLNGVLEWVRTMQAELMQDFISGSIQQKSMEVDLAFYESADYFDKLYRARDEASTRPAALLDHLGSVMQNAVSLFVLTALVARYSPWMFLVMMLSVVPAFAVVTRHNWIMHRWWRESTVHRRWISYYDAKFSTAAAAPEIRLLGLGPLFRNRYSELRRGLRIQRLRFIGRQSVSRVLAALAGMVIVGASLAWMGWRALRGMASLGDLTLFYQAIVGGQGIMRGAVSSLSQSYTNSLFLGDFFQFLDLKPKIADPSHPVAFPPELSSGIRFERVSFSYPGSQRSALKNFNLTIPHGRIVAVVGPNGAGKSTLLKLACRFYDVDAGRVTIDGIDLRKFSLSDLRANLSVLFQMPVSYDASARENIAFGSVTQSQDHDRIQAAAKSAGAHEIVRRLPDGYDTPLGKSFTDGTELSAGEWQRIAMARAFLRQSPIILLDEPTSFMDSWAELEWFDRLRKLAAGRTALIITHRFSIAMRADLIHVMKDGSVCETGTHEELLDHNGFYSESWQAQMESNRAGGETAAQELEPTLEHSDQNDPALLHIRI